MSKLKQNTTLQWQESNSIITGMLTWGRQTPHWQNDISLGVKLAVTGKFSVVVLVNFDDMDVLLVGICFHIAY